MKKADAETLHKYLISKWLSEENPTKDEFGLVSFHDYLAYAEKTKPGCLEFRCRAGARFEVERWFDYATGQSWTR